MKKIIACLKEVLPNNIIDKEEESQLSLNSIDKEKNFSFFNQAIVQDLKTPLPIYDLNYYHSYYYNTEKKMFTPKNKLEFGDLILYDGFFIQKLLQKLIKKHEQELPLSKLNILITDKLLCTFDESDWRYHARSLICGTPTLISTAGIVEGIAKPPDYYYKLYFFKENPEIVDELKKEYNGQFINYNDHRINDIIEGLVLDGSVDDGMEALKRAIEIDISYAKRAVRDRDFENAKAEEGFRRIIEVVVLEAIRQGYDYTGKIIWITGMDKVDVDDALLRLSMKGLVVRKEKKNFFNKEEYFELSKEISLKVGSFKRSGFMGKSREVSPPVQQLKDISEILSKMRDSVEQGDVEATIGYFDKLINPSIHGSTMIEKFFNEHRDLRLYQNRLKDKGQEYLNSHKSDFIKLMIEIDSKVRGTHFSNNVIDN